MQPGRGHAKQKRTHDFLTCPSTKYKDNTIKSNYHELDQTYTVREIFDKRRHFRIVVRFKFRVEPLDIQNEVDIYC